MAKQSKMRDKFSPLTVIMLVILSAFVTALLFMLVWGFMQTLKHPHLFAYDKTSFWKFNDLTFANYSAVIQYANYDRWMGQTGSPNFPEMILNTILYAVGGAFLNVSVMCLMAYLTARYSYFYSKIIYTIVIVVMVVPIVGAQASEIEILKNFHLYNKRFSFMVLKAGFVGMYFLVFYAAFKTIPMTYSEAAMMDGASDWCIMVKICLPLTLNVFMTVFLITFIQFWNDYQLAMLYMPSYPTLSFFVFNYQNRRMNVNVPGYEFNPVDTGSKTTVLAATFFLIIPIAIIFIALHERLMGNLSIGGIKG